MRPLDSVEPFLLGFSWPNASDGELLLIRAIAGHAGGWRLEPSCHSQLKLARPAMVKMPQKNPPSPSQLSAPLQSFPQLLPSYALRHPLNPLSTLGSLLYILLLIGIQEYITTTTHSRHLIVANHHGGVHFGEFQPGFLLWNRPLLLSHPPYQCLWSR
jgi:hypothetical protein